VTTTSFAHQTVDPSPSLHYYVLHDHTGEPSGLLAEEFLPAKDYSSAGLVSASWSRPDNRWHDGAAASRRLRLDATLRAHAAPTNRAAAASLYRTLCHTDLPPESTLRACFGSLPAPPPPPLRLGGHEPTPGFHETRVYRILLANEPTQPHLDALSRAWQTPVSPQSRILTTVHRHLSGNAFRWDLRRIAGGAAWSLDLTRDLATAGDETVGLLLRALTAQLHERGLIPTTIDRFR
jgi:hypothetical protein